jgi:hypothetical protein
MFTARYRRRLDAAHYTSTATTGRSQRPSTKVNSSGDDIAGLLPLGVTGGTFSVAGGIALAT